MYTKGKIAYDFNGKRIWNYRHESEMTSVEFAAKAQMYLNRYFKAIEQGREKMADILLSAANSYYAKAANAK